MYSTDRLDALKYTVSCLEDMYLYDKCQKTLIVDGKIDLIPPDWEVIQVPRVNNKFCWAKMWDAGVLSAKYEKILYLDSDRLLPKIFLEIIENILEDDLFLFTSKHFMMNTLISIEDCKNVLEYFDKNKNKYSLEGLRYEIRNENPYHGPEKNVMSGSTAFTKKTYLRLGGVDHWYCGHGAFADNDFHMQAACGDCSFIDLNIPEIHYLHEKIDDKSNPIKQKDLWLMGLDNFIYYCDKWNLPFSLAEGVASQCGVKKPISYVKRRQKVILG